MSRKILFVSHEASRTGAPKILLFFLRWLSVHSDFQIFIVLKRGGELVSEFQALGEVFIWPTERINNSVFAKGVAKVGVPLETWSTQHLNRQFRKHNFDLIYVNSITCSDIIVSIKKAGIRSPVVCHVHELNIIIKLLAPDLAEAKKFITRYVAVSEATKRNLVETEGISEDSIELVYEFIPVDEVRLTRSVPSVIRKEIGVPQNSFLIGGAGFVHWRKGYDLFINVAKTIDTLHPDNKFFYVWVGYISDENSLIVEEDLKKAGLHQKVKFTGAFTNPQDYFQAYDIFLLPSREDPFPLVCLEAIALGKPIVCFEGAGGIPELVERGCGVAVPYLDTLTMAKKVIELSEQPELLAAWGRKAQAISGEYAAASACSKLASIIDNTIAF